MMRLASLARRGTLLLLAACLLAPLLSGCSGPQQATPQQDQEREAKKKSDK